MKRLLGAILVGSLVFGAVLASAATLNVNAGTIQVGSDMTLQCDTDGVNVDWNFTGVDAYVTSIQVSGVNDAACVGQHIYTYVFDGFGNVIAVGHPYNETPPGTQTPNDPCGAVGSAMSELPTTIFSGTTNYKIGLSLQPGNTCGVGISDIWGIRLVIGV
jgi:hypothetical protein